MNIFKLDIGVQYDFESFYAQVALVFNASPHAKNDLSFLSFADNFFFAGSSPPGSVACGSAGLPERAEAGCDPGSSLAGASPGSVEAPGG